MARYFSFFIQVQERAHRIMTRRASETRDSEGKNIPDKSIRGTIDPGFIVSLMRRLSEDARA